MRRVGKKIGGRSGATMLFAILVFMLCALTGVAALTAAAANSGRYTHVKEEQQEYLSMSSAVNLMREELVGKTGKTFTAQVTKTETKDASGNLQGDPDVSWVTGSPKYDGGFSGQLLDVFKGFYLNKLSGVIPASEISKLGATKSPPYEETLTFTTGDEVIDKYKVTAKFAVDKDFNITVNFSLTDGTNEIKAYGTDMTIRANVDGINSSSRITNKTYDTSGKVASTTTETTYTMKVTWLEENTTISEKDTLKTEGA